MNFDRGWARIWLIAADKARRDFFSFEAVFIRVNRPIRGDPRAKDRCCVVPRTT
jgi:hypothetical protein